MKFAKSFLDGLTRLETAVAVFALALTAVALLSDLAGREIFQQGLFGALRVAVYATAVSALLGFVLCVAHMSHIRVSVFDGLTPKKWEPVVTRVGDVISLCICIYFAYWSYFYVNQTYVLGETDPSLNIKVWPMQCALIWAFASGGVRFLFFAIYPGLRPDEDEVVS